MQARVLDRAQPHEFTKIAVGTFAHSEVLCILLLVHCPIQFVSVFRSGCQSKGSLARIITWVHAQGGDLLWLIWKYEGDFTLFDLLQKRDWPYNAEALLRGSGQPSQNRSVRRKTAIIRTMMKSILEGLSACHANGDDSHFPGTLQ